MDPSLTETVVRPAAKHAPPVPLVTPIVIAPATDAIGSAPMVQAHAAPAPTASETAMRPEWIVAAIVMANVVTARLV